ncbi:MAG: response regulator transcription factor [Prevotella sp.]|nr:response regulator transcription factor [Prevotella sp.]MDY5258208.1 response regulator transcription factor [Prevotella sp.]
MKILIIEDQRSLSDSIRDYLHSQHYLCEQAFDYAQAKLMVGCYKYDCVLLDLMLPGGNGLDILQSIRSKNNDTGVIIISAKGALDDKLRGLQLGADDYLAKPFALSELSMRIYALIRRREFSSSNLFRSDGIIINLLTKEVTVDGKVVELTRSEYDLLLFFLSNKGKVLSKMAIAEHLSGEMADMMSNFDFVYSHIKNLKSKLSKVGAKGCVKTIYATGYKWV